MSVSRLQHFIPHDHSKHAIYSDSTLDWSQKMITLTSSKDTCGHIIHPPGHLVQSIPHSPHLLISSTLYKSCFATCLSDLLFLSLVRWLMRRAKTEIVCCPISHYWWDELTYDRNLEKNREHGDCAVVKVGAFVCCLCSGHKCLVSFDARLVVNTYVTIMAFKLKCVLPNVKVSV